MKVWIYVNMSKQLGDVGHLKVFADKAHANAWFDEHDPKGRLRISRDRGTPHDPAARR